MSKIVLLFLIIYVQNVHNTIIEVGNSDGYSRRTVSGSLLNNITDAYSLTLIEYGEDDAQITKIEDMPLLDIIVIKEVNQKIISRFKNVPVLRRINFSKNDVNYIAADMFGHTTVELIWLYGSKIELIEDGSFGDKVRVVSMYCNNVEIFRPEWFKNPSILQELVLNGNRIKSIRKNAFKDFTSLKSIDLSFNGIKTIGTGAFTGRNNFGNVLLAHNNLKILDIEIFQTGPIHMNYFDVRYNNLTFLPKKLLERLTVEKTPVIDGNPWQCPCYDDYIHNWVNWTTYGNDRFNPKDRKGEPRCVKAIGSFAKTCVEFISEELIDFYRENTSPPDTNRDKYCTCIRNARSGVGDWECYFGEDFKFVQLPN